MGIFQIKTILIVILALFLAGITSYVLKRFIFRILPAMLRSVVHLLGVVLGAIINLPATLLHLIKILLKTLISLPVRLLYAFKQLLIFLFWELPQMLLESLIKLAKKSLKFAFYASGFLVVLVMWLFILTSVLGI